MKRIFYLLGTVAAIFAFTACEDVPEPYVINSEGGNTNTSTLLSETFKSSLGKFTNFTTEGGVSWVNSFSCATATGYDNATKTTTDGVAYLVGPSVDLTNVDSAYVTYEYILRYNRKNEYQKLLIAEDFVPNANNVTEQTWTELFANHIEGKDYNTFSTAEIDIPADFMGKKVRLALYFKSETNSSTWEVKNFKVVKGAAGESGDNPTPTPTPTDGALPYTSASLKDGFTVQTETGTPWSLGNTYAKATGYANNATTPTVTWLISPAVNTTKAEGNEDAVVVDFDYVLRYVGAGTDVAAYHKLYASTDYDGDATKATWTDLGFTAVESATKDWTFYAAPTITLPDNLVGQEKVFFAFRFECNAQNSTTWELKNFNVHQGTGGDNPPTPPTPTPTGDNLIANGDFESWKGNEPIYWQSTTTASSSGILSPSSETHGGNYSVRVAGNSAANRRIAYTEITLKAGTYNMKFYAKAATEAGGSVRPGYTPVTDGKVGSYAYGEYVNDLTTTDWTEVNHSFTLDAQTTVNLVIMNPKNPGADVLIDDFELTTSNGGLVSDGGNDGGDGGDDTDTSIPYGILFTQSTAGWTIEDIDLGGLSYVWKQDTRFGMKASAYNNGNYAAEALLVSPVFDIPEDGPVYMSMSHALNFLKDNPREDFVSVEVKLSTGEIEELPISNWPAGTSYDFVDVNILLNEYYGKSVQFIFHYKSTTACAPTWEIDSFSLHN